MASTAAASSSSAWPRLGAAAAGTRVDADADALVDADADADADVCEAVDDSLYTTATLEDRVSIGPTEWGDGPAALNSVLHAKLVARHEGRCSRDGYVRPGSLALVSRTAGLSLNARFTGNFVYQVRATVRVLIPTPGSLLPCTVLVANRVGVYAVFEEAVRLLLPRDMHDEARLPLNDLAPGASVLVRLLKARFQPSEQFITAVGMRELSNDDSGATPALNHSHRATPPAAVISHV